MFYEIKKDAIKPILKARITKPEETNTFGDYVIPPFSYTDIMNFYGSNPYHSQAIEVKKNYMLAKEYITKAKDFLDEITIEGTFFELMDETLEDFFCYGNAYWEVVVFGGKIKEIYHVPSNTMYIRQNKTFLQVVGMNCIDFQNIERAVGDGNYILHFRRYSSLSSYYGVPKWLSAIESLRLDLNTKLFLSSFFANHAMPDFAIIVEGAEVAKEVEEKIHEALTLNRGIDNAHKILLLSIPFPDVKVKIEKITQDLKSFELDKTYENIRNEIITAHGVPPRLVGIVDAGKIGDTQEGASQLEMFLKGEIRKTQRYFAARINKFLLQKNGIEPDFSFPPPYKEEEEKEEEPELLKWDWN